MLGRVTPAGHIVFSVDERVDVNLTCRELETAKGEACEDQLRPWGGCAWGGGYLVTSISFPSRAKAGRGQDLNAAPLMSRHLVGEP